MRASIIKHRSRIVPTSLIHAVILGAASLAYGQVPQAAPGGTSLPSETQAPSQAAATPEAKSAPKEANNQATAPSDADRELAAQALAKGQEAYTAADYVAAAAHFAASLGLAPSPEAALGRAMALDMQGKPAEAIVAFETLFADPGHSALPAGQLEPARQRLEVLKQIPASVTLHVTPPNAVLKVNGAVQAGNSPFSLSLTAGSYQLELSGEGLETAQTDLQVQAAQKVEQAIELKTLPAPPATTPADKPAQAPKAAPAPRSLVPAYVTLGVAGAGAIVGTIFGLQALAAKDDFDKQRTTAAADDVERNALIADMAFGMAITLGITGVVLLTSDEPAESPRTARRLDRASSFAQVRVAPFVSPTSAGAAALTTF